MNQPLVTQETVLIDLACRSRTELLAAVSAPLGRICGLEATDIATALNAREALGSTGVGDGVAIPHASLAGVTRPLGAFARLARPLEFDAIDDRPVDLVFVLLTPAAADTQALGAIARVARALRLPDLRDRLRRARDAGEIAAILEAAMA